MKRTLRLSLQSPEAPETSFSIRPRQCVHSRGFDECRTCSLRDNINKTVTELFFADLEWHSTWKQEQLLWNAIVEVRKTVVNIANLSKAMYEIVDLDVHELLTNLQYLIESIATQHNFLSVMNAVKGVMKTPTQNLEAKAAITSLIEATGKLGVVLELLSAKGSPAVDPNCKQLMQNPEQGAGNYRRTTLPSNEWETLN